jgi:hypothetical protein
MSGREFSCLCQTGKTAGGLEIVGKPVIDARYPAKSDAG